MTPSEERVFLNGGQEALDAYRDHGPEPVDQRLVRFARDVIGREHEKERSAFWNMKPEEQIAVMESYKATQKKAREARLANEKIAAELRAKAEETRQRMLDEADRLRREENAEILRRQAAEKNPYRVPIPSALEEQLLGPFELDMHRKANAELLEILGAPPDPMDRTVENILGWPGRIFSGVSAVLTMFIAGYCFNGFQGAVISGFGAIVAIAIRWAYQEWPSEVPVNPRPAPPTPQGFSPVIQRIKDMQAQQRASNSDLNALLKQAVEVAKAQKPVTTAELYNAYGPEGMMHARQAQVNKAQRSDGEVGASFEREVTLEMAKRRAEDQAAHYMNQRLNSVNETFLS